jgi:hypothetical protein
VHANRSSLCSVPDGCPHTVHVIGITFEDDDAFDGDDDDDEDDDMDDEDEEEEDEEEPARQGKPRFVKAHKH